MLLQVSSLENGIGDTNGKEGCNTNGLHEALNADSWNDVECDKMEDEGECDKTVPLPDEEEEDYFPVLKATDTKDPTESAEPCDPSSPEVAATCDPLRKKEEHVGVKWPSNQSSFNVSRWSVDLSSEKPADFINEKFNILGHREGNPYSIGKKTGSLLTNPQDIAYIAHSNAFIVPETIRNRVGVYNAENWDFLFWLPHPR